MKPGEQDVLIEQVKQIADGLAQTFAPFCEVLVHDLQDPAHSIIALHNNLSGRQLGDPTTEVGLARVADDQYPQVIANYSNRFSDGRPVKSTSIGIKDSSGKYIAALCLNVDVSIFRGVQELMARFTRIEDESPVESLDPAGAELIRKRIDEFAARMATTPRALRVEDRRVLLKELKHAGLLEVRKAMDIIALHLGVSRATVYVYSTR